MTEGFFKDPLDWVLIQLQGDPDGVRRYDHAMLFSFLNECMNNSPAAERARLDQKLYDKLSDFAALHELLTAVRFHRPLSTLRYVSDVQQTEQRKYWRCTRPSNSQADRSDASAMGIALSHFDHLPIPSGKKNLEWLEHLQNSRNGLTAFWSIVREDRKQGAEKRNYSSVDIEYELDPLSADTSSEYLAAVEAERLAILERLKNVNSVAIDSNESMQTQWGDDSSQGISLPTKSKSKQKTRSRAHPAVVPAHDVPHPLRTTVQKPIPTPTASTKDDPKELAYHISHTE